MSSEIRTCPHCGFGVAGNTPRCPRCDGLLETLVISPPPLETAAEHEPLDDFASEISTEPPFPAFVSSTPSSSAGQVTESDVTLPDLPPPVKRDAPSTFEMPTDAPVAQAAYFAPPVAPEPARVVLDTPPLGTRPSEIPMPPVPTPPPVMSPLEPAPYPYIELPPAPFTPPPQPAQPAPALPPTPASVPYGTPAAPMPSNYWLQQRIQAYKLGRYEMKRETPYEALLAYGKPLSLFWWVFGTFTLIGMLWYFLILLFSGFRKDKAHIILEPDGYIFEEGSGAAHIRRRRWRSGKRWGFLGILLALISLFMFGGLVLALSVVSSEYEQELRAAYPELTFFEDQSEDLEEARIEEARLIILVFTILFSLSLIGFFSGLLLAIINYIQAAAYRVEVVPLPGFK